jgi:phosphoribosylformylglycinamidine synthase
LHDVSGVVLPGGFSYGDYLRCGAIARFAPVMATIIDAARVGLPVLGICNGFQVLCESHLLPGALIRNDHRKFVCRDQRLRRERCHGVDVDYESGVEVIPIKNGEGVSPPIGGRTNSRPRPCRGRYVPRPVESCRIAKPFGAQLNGSYRISPGSNAAGNVVG